jgi:glutamine synthetase
MPGRDIVERHTAACLKAGLGIEGTNAEVMMGQWEFQLGVLGTVEIGDQMWVARWLLKRISEEFDVDVSFDAKPIKGDWNGAGAHTNFSTKQTRGANGWPAIIAACEALGARVKEHISNYGAGIEDRLTGAHETAHFTTFSYGVSDRGASVRIPGQVAREKRGYIEDRRPNANVDPYVVARLMVETVCGAAKPVAAKKAPAKKVAAKKAPATRVVKKATSPVRKAAR